MEKKIGRVQAKYSIDNGKTWVLLRSSRLQYDYPMPTSMSLYSFDELYESEDEVFNISRCKTKSGKRWININGNTYTKKDGEKILIKIEWATENYPTVSDLAKELTADDFMDWWFDEIKYRENKLRQ